MIESKAAFVSYETVLDSLKDIWIPGKIPT